jgi:hypothetical protein
MNAAIAEPFDLLPAPAVVHERLGKCLREAALLRRLLRLSIRAEAEREQRTAGEPERGSAAG